MFTGIVAAVGRILSSEAITDGGGRRLRIDAGGLDLDDVRIGDSIAIQGACMTVVKKTADLFEVDVSQESLTHTVGLAELGEVNLEKALRLADRIGGHLVTGHVDGLGDVLQFEPVGESHLLRVAVPGELSMYVARKGSITVNGVSLTVNRVADHDGRAQIDMNLIPHTVAVTTLRHLREGVRVNLEIDLIARYVQRLQAFTPDT